MSALLREFETVPICPEMLAGLPCPRPRAEIVLGCGFDVLDGRAKVVDSRGGDVTEAFLRGAQAVLNLALANDIGMAFLKEKSPSCGVNRIYVNGALQEGRGVTAALLSRHGLQIIGVE